MRYNGRMTNASIGGFLQRLTSSFQVLPPVCVLCGATGLRELDLCTGCREDLPRNDDACDLCALPLPGAATACGACLRKPPPFAATFAAFRYRFPIDQMVQRLKFGGDLAVGRVLGSLLREALPAHWPTLDLVVPMPLARARLGARGCNQAQELARAMPWPLDVDALQRVRETTPQTALDARARRANVRDAFLAGEAVRDRSVALVDDVITTGATVGAATEALLAAGAREVRVVALARASRRDDL